MIRVAFSLIGGRQWMGGRNYLRNLLAVIDRYEASRVKPILFVGSSTSDEDLAPFQSISSVEIVKAPAFDPPGQKSGLMSAIVTGRDGAACRQFAANRIDAVFESAQFYGWRLSYPAIAWFPDFQHRHLPHLFSRAERLKRDIGFRVQIAAGRQIMLSSGDAERDFKQFFAVNTARTHVVRFAILPVEGPNDGCQEDVASQYGLHEPFFFLPNQFWRHKNHTLVVEALYQLKARGRRVVVAATGHQFDPRCPEHFPALERSIREAGLTDMFRLLGPVPFRHIAALMQQSVALLNPSLFEGWSTTVEEARMLGTPMLLSDLAVHREQMGDAAIYFDRTSPASLASALENFTPLDERHRQLAFNLARSEAERRAREFAATFADLIEVTTSAQ